MPATKHECKRCGECCTFVEFPIGLQDVIWANLHDLRVVQKKSGLWAQADLPCTAYDWETHSCTRYDFRPFTCRVFECERS